MPASKARAVRDRLIAVTLAATLGSALHTGSLSAQGMMVAGRPSRLDVRAAGSASVRVTLVPLGYRRELPYSPAVVDRPFAEPAITVATLPRPVRRRVGQLMVEVRPAPLTVAITSLRGAAIQRLTFEDDGTVSFVLDSAPVLGMGEGGPRPAPGTPWREQPVQFDRRGTLDTMEPRWQSDMYGSRNPVAMLLGTAGWALFVPTPWVQVDLRDRSRGRFIPWVPTADSRAPQTERNQQQNAGKGLPPANSVVAGVYDLFVFDAHEPAATMKDFAAITGPAVLPPKWALGYMQSHRTLEDETQLLGIIDTFRAKAIPLDAVIYLGTGFSPRGWNTPQPSFTFNPDVFKREPSRVLADMHDRHVKVVVHMVPWDRDRLPTLHGSIPPKPGERVDPSHIQIYWQQHVGLITAGVDAFWPDEGDWFDLFERLKRHQLYYQGPLSTTPNVRPWSLHRNGYPGIARWGGWVWSGDTESSWKTLEAQIAVGVNYSLSIGPYWGSDIGGFYANRELTGELYARWVEFAAFCGSFRAHGRTWWTRLPWGWGLSDMGPRENSNTNAPIPADDRRNILQSEMSNPAIEPVARRYIELRYQLLPYTYTLAWEARNMGLPLMRALWLHYPDDARSRATGDEYLWGRDLLIAPVYRQSATSRDVYLPPGDWYDWWTGERLAGGRTITRGVDLATMPIFVRAGAIVPVDPIRQYASQPVSEPTTLRVYSGADGRYVLYDDDGISQQYLKNRGSWTRLTWTDRGRRLTIAPGAPIGATNVVTPRTFEVVMIPTGRRATVTYAGTPVTVTLK
jgi:alpha-glucosidase/alpha-D-xyloside xylohydrolase